MTACCLGIKSELSTFFSKGRSCIINADSIKWNTHSLVFFFLTDFRITVEKKKSQNTRKSRNQFLEALKEDVNGKANVLLLVSANVMCVVTQKYQFDKKKSFSLEKQKFQYIILEKLDLLCMHCKGRL